jgi:hypothetical protein
LIGRRFASRLTLEGQNVLSERFGPFKILLSLVASNGKIAMLVVRWRLGSVPLLLALAPKSETCEFVGEDGRFHFDVAIKLTIGGLLAHYRGWLEPKALTHQRLAERLPGLSPRQCRQGQEHREKRAPAARQVLFKRWNEKDGTIMPLASRVVCHNLGRVMIFLRNL